MLAKLLSPRLLCVVLRSTLYSSFHLLHSPYKQMDSIIHLKSENDVKSETLLIPFRLPFFKSAAEAQKGEAISCRHVFTIIPEKMAFLWLGCFIGFFVCFMS